MALVRDIKAAVSGHGHGCSCHTCREAYQGENGLDNSLLWRLAGGAALFAAACLLRGPLPVPSRIAAIASLLCAGYDRFIRAVARCIRRRAVDEDLLMAVIIIAAAAIDRTLEAAASMLLVQLASLLAGASEAGAEREYSLLTGQPRPADGEDPAAGEAFVRSFTRIYTPVILGAAVITSVLFPTVFHTTVREGIRRSVTLMMIACPCAAVMAVPLAYRAGLGGAAALGAALSGTGVLGKLARVDTVVFEQQAALEGPGLRVISVRSDRMEPDVLLRIAAHACAYSDEAAAEAVKAACRDTIYIELIQSFQQEPGRGITVEVDGVSIILGRVDFMREHGVDPGEDTVEEPCAYLAIDGRYAGRVLLGPVPLDTAADAVSALTRDRDRRVVLVSEAPAAGVERFARLVGIGQYYGGSDAPRRAGIVEELKSGLPKNRALLFAGSARRDPEAFSAADLTLSYTLDGADITAPGGDPLAVGGAVEAGCRTGRIVLETVIFILGFKLLALALDMAGFCPLWLAVLADAGVSLAAVLSAARAVNLRASAR